MVSSVGPLPRVHVRYDVVARRVAAPTLLAIPTQEGCRESVVDLQCLGAKAVNQMWSGCIILQQRLYGAVAPPSRHPGERRGEQRAVRSPPGSASVMY